MRATSSFSARYRWEYEPGNEIFAAFGQGATVTGDSFLTGQRFAAQRSLLSIRIGHTFRF